MKGILIAWKDAAPAAGALTAILSAFVALLVFRYTRAANRRRATLDMVMKTLLDDNARIALAEFKTLLRKAKDSEGTFKLDSLAAPEKRGDPERSVILRHLNIYELMALGIRRGIFDEVFYKRWYHNQFMIDYEGCVDFIKVIQENKSSIFCECTALYRKWVKHGHPEHSTNRFIMAWWGLTKQTEKLDEIRAKSKAR